MMHAVSVAAILVFAGADISGKEKPDAQLQSVTSLYIAGNNQAAEKVRDVLRAGKTCFVLAPKAADADATLEVSVDAQTQGGMSGHFGGRSWVASGALTLRSGDLVWSRSERGSDGPLMSGGKHSGDRLIRRLARDAGCGNRPKRD